MNEQPEETTMTVSTTAGIAAGDYIVVEADKRRTYRIKCVGEYTLGLVLVPWHRRWAHWVRGRFLRVRWWAECRFWDTVDRVWPEDD